MSEEPYRNGEPPSPADDELSRLAAEGQGRIDAAAERNAAQSSTAADETRDHVIRAALGAHYGSPVRRARLATFGVLALAIAGGLAASVVGGDLRDLLGTICAVLGGAAFIAAMILVSLQPRATAARVAAEQAWSSSLPFKLRGHFDLLASDDVVAIHVVADIEFARTPPDASLVQGAVGVLDVDARVSREGDTTLRIRGAALPNTFIDYRKRRENTNRQHVAYVHALVDRVLAPLHRSHPVASVTLSRDTDLSDEESGRVAQLGFLLRKW
jgi:hypothetical protein